MFKTTLAATLLAVASTTSAVELTNDTLLGTCSDVVCALSEAGISFIGTQNMVEGASEYVVILSDPEDASVACDVASEYGENILFLVGDELRGC